MEETERLITRRSLTMCRKFIGCNVQDGSMDVQVYIDCADISEWHEWKTGLDLPAGVHRKLREKTVVVIKTKSGGMQWCNESFAVVSARILEARGQTNLAEVERADAAAEKARGKSSPLAVS